MGVAVYRLTHNIEKGNPFENVLEKTLLRNDLTIQIESLFYSIPF